MPSLDDVLLHTYLRQAALQPGAVGTCWPADATVSGGGMPDVKLGPHVPPPLWADSVLPPLEAVARNPIWSWTQRGGQLDRFVDVDCWVRATKKVARVLEEVRFHDVAVRPVGGARVDLPLDAAFLVRREVLDEGETRRGAHPLWAIATVVDRSALNVFAYEVRPDGLAPVPEAALNAPDFMPAPGEPAALRVAAGETLALRHAPLRVVVCVSLVTNRELANWEPLGILGAGRLFPHVMVMANAPLEEVTASTTARRPAQRATCPADDMNDDMGVLLVADSNEGLLDEFKSHLPAWSQEKLEWAMEQLGLQALGLPLADPPFWNVIFDYYDPDPLGDHWDAPASPFQASAAAGPPRWKGKSDRFVAVRPWDAGDPAPPPLRGVIDRHLTGVTYVAGEIAKVPGQGAFDNIHFAPSMNASALVTDNYGWSASPMGAAHYIDRLGLDRVVMAPFCFHDCYHAHWRWGTSFGTLPEWQDHVRGWDDGYDPAAPFGPGTPYARAGAPMVPRNQEVSVTLHSRREWTEVVRALPFRAGGEPTPPPPGVWTVIGHHGAAYGITVQPAVQAAVALAFACLFQGQIPPEPLAARSAYSIASPNPAAPRHSTFSNTPMGPLPYPPLRPNWSLIYWHLRFAGRENASAFKLDDEVAERIRIHDLARAKG